MSQKSTTQYWSKIAEGEATSQEREAEREEEERSDWHDDNPNAEWAGMDDWEYRQWEREHGI